ncbi:MAG: tetratricopeptide repeat protein [bacterium]
MKKNLSPYIPYAILVFLSLAVYLNCLGNSFVADDLPVLVNNPALKEPQFALYQFPIFLRHLQYFLTFKFFGLNVTAFRIPNLLWHTGFVLTSFAVLKKVLSDKARFFETAPFWATAVLAVHPLQSEAVVWITGGSYVLYAFLLMLGLLCYIKGQQENSPKYYWATFGIFLLSLTASEKAAVFPLIIIAYELGFSNLKKNWKRVLPFFLISLGYTGYFAAQIPQRLAGIGAPETQETLSSIFQVPAAISSYLELIAWPAKLTLYHSEMIFSKIQMSFKIGVTLIFGGLTVAAFFKKARPLFFWFAFFIIVLLPTLTPLGISWIVAERYVYPAGIGIYAVFFTLLTKLKIPPEFKKILLPAIGSLLVLILFFRTITRNLDWKTADALWLSAEKISLHSPQNHNNLGDYYGRQGNLLKSVQEFETAIALKPGYADAYHNLANTYQQMGNLGKAEKNYLKAIEYNPYLWQSYQNLGAIYFNAGEYEKAKAMFEKALQINPGNANYEK